MNNSNPQLPKKLVYLGLALDPLHVGTGGYRLGRVDMSITREPGTNLPKIPATSIAGACRTYAAMQTDGKFPHCAGQGKQQGSNQGHCGKPDCPVCVTFGFSKGQAASFQGLAQFSDARLVLFPVHSLAGPVWVTCPDALRDWGPAPTEPVAGTVRAASGLKPARIGSGQPEKRRLNLGWLMLDVVDDGFTLDGAFKDVPGEIRERAVLVSNKLFGHIVNDNLEVRTSVSIDPQTGAAADKALFTYEALPRASVLMFEVVVSDPQFYQIPSNGAQVTPLNGDMSQVTAAVDRGSKLFEYLGVGGMNTRGMGRIKVNRAAEAAQ